MLMRIVAALLGVFLAGAALAAEAELSCAPNTQRILMHDVFELTFRHDGALANPFFDVTIDVIFTSPTGKTFKVGGFHYGSTEKPTITAATAPGRGGRQIRYEFAKADTWKARFAPNEAGRWTYVYTWRGGRPGVVSGQGSFECVRGRRPLRGFVRIDPNNPYQFIYDDGSPFFPIGVQECLGDGNANGTVLDQMSMEGPFRPDPSGARPALPPGPMFARGPSMNPVNADVYFRRYGQAGFNIFRFSQENCSYPLNQNYERYLVQQGIMTDELLIHARKYGFVVMYGIFGFQPAFNKETDNVQAMEKIKRFIKYSVDRWGAYTDIWELLNEQHADTAWYNITVPYLKSIDPYHRPLTTSWERPDVEGIDINAPHWYTADDQLRAIGAVNTRAGAWKKPGKPVIVNEHGNHVTSMDPAARPPTQGGVWDPTSAVRMRIRNWAALFNEISYIFWNTSYAKDGHHMNIWLGPLERQYVRAMQDFAYSLGGGIKSAQVATSRMGEARAYALASDRRVGVYINHFRDHVNPVRDLTVSVQVPLAAKGYWYCTEDARILGTVDVPAGLATLTVPEFLIDIALLITPDGPPDIDKDGIPNDVDDDNDNDGVPNAKDAFPLEAEEWADVDGDLIGDNLDADKNGDGIGDDDNGNGIPDHEEMDLDGDGYPRAGAVPWDAFPNDRKEWRDTDGDGIGDNADTDDDGDGWSDEEEKQAGTDPLSRLSFP